MGAIAPRDLARTRAAQALVARGIEPTGANLSWQVPRTIRAGRGAALALDHYDGVDLVVVTDHGGLAVMAEGSIVVEVWLRGEGEGWTRKARAIQGATDEVIQSRGQRGITVVRPSTWRSRFAGRLRVALARVGRRW